MLIKDYYYAIGEVSLLDNKPPYSFTTKVPNPTESLLQRLAQERPVCGATKSFTQLVPLIVIGFSRVIHVYAFDLQEMALTRPSMAPSWRIASTTTKPLRYVTKCFQQRHQTSH